jgi:hypothetical protein
VTVEQLRKEGTLSRMKTYKYASTRQHIIIMKGYSVKKIPHSLNSIVPGTDMYVFIIYSQGLIVVGVPA